MPRIITFAALLPVLALAQTPSKDVKQTPMSNLQIEKLGTLEYPWGLALLPDGRVLVTEKPGRLRIFADGKLSEPIENVPAVAHRPSPKEQGGLLDVTIDPEFERNSFIYLSYSEQAPKSPAQSDTDDPRFAGAYDVSDNRLMGGAVMRARLDGHRLADGQVIWRQEPKTVGRGHFGHRLVFGRDGALFITSGERMRFDPAQSLSSTLGKVIRINRDGSTPRDNPFVGKGEVADEVWSLGHRNMLAAAIHPVTGQLWVGEMGPLGGDELNLIVPGGNYGWPIVSDGDNYDKSPIPDHRTKPAFTAPIRTWTPVISPSGALFYFGTLFPWKGNLILGGLSSKGLVRLTLDGATVTAEERIDLQRRVRDLIELKDGSLLVITDDQNGELLRVTPAGPGLGTRRPGL